jgi:hypothetical protein
MASYGLAIALSCALACSWSGGVNAQPVGEHLRPARASIAAYVREASQRFGVPERWIKAVIRIESAGRIHVVSSAGAMGLMQLMPGTWARQRARYGLGSDPFDPRDNIMAGTSYLREMYDRYGAAGFLAAYNAGPGRYEEWRDKGRPLPLETRRYVAAIAPLLQDQSGPSAALVLPDGAAPSGPSRTIEPSLRAESASGAAIAAHPFARAAMPRHDLFVPVSTPSGE